jgi:hypothetical protein
MMNGIIDQLVKVRILKPTMKGKEVWVVLTMGELEGDGPGEGGIG